MLKFSQLCFWFFVVFCQVHFNYGRTRIDKFLSPNNDFVKTIENLGFPLSGFRDPNTAVKVLSHLGKYWQKVKYNFSLRRMELLDFIGNLSDNKCFRDMGYYIHSLLSGNTWAFEMLDAYGKPSSGILKGHVMWLGDYNECTNIYIPPENDSALGDFHTQYCSLHISIEISTKVVPLSYGICIPDSCNFKRIADDVNKFLNSYTEFLPFLGRIDLPVSVTDAICQPASKPLTSGALAILVILGVLILLAIIGTSLTACDCLARRMAKYNSHSSSDMQMIVPTITHGNCENIPRTDAVWSHSHRDSIQISQTSDIIERWTNVKSFFQCFCCFTNGAFLFSFQEREQLLCLNGIRVLSFCWILLFHITLSNIDKLGNALDAIDMMDNWAFLIVLNPLYSVDSFFLISGCLAAHNFFKEYSRTGGKISWLNFYLHRYIRLTPTYMLVLGSFATLLYYIANGPLATTGQVEPFCSENWWQNLLYINNFFYNYCLGMSWYLAVDMQFFIISPLFLVTLWKWPKIGYSLMALFICASFAINFTLSYKYNLISGFSNAIPITESMEYMKHKYNEFFDAIYDKPYTRISPYLVGIAVAYCLFQRNQKSKGKGINVFLQFIGWTLSSAAALGGLFCMYHQKNGTTLNNMYNAVIHISYAFALGWVVFVCCAKQGGIVNSILSFKGFIPLSRLTYCAYLIHMLIVFGYFRGIKRPFHYDHHTLVIYFLALLMETYFFSLIVHLLFEAPFLRLEKFVKSRFRSSPG